MSPTLTTIPPELLLQILNHLPTQFLNPLSQTSSYLHTFLHTHAATICNTQILTSYPHAASILRSTYSPDGWYLPTHPCVLAEERRMIRDKILYSGCHCPPCREVLRSSSEDLDLDLDFEMEREEGETGLGWIEKRTAGCKAKKEIDSCLKLSAPGPQFRVFLEKYSWEIETRRAMSSFGTTPTSSSPTSTADSSQTTTTAPSPTGTAAGNEEGEGNEEEKGKELMFEFMIGNYCVRRFLESAEKCLQSLTSASSANSSPTSSSTLVNPKTNASINRLRRKLRKHVRAKEKENHDEEVQERGIREGSGPSPSTSPSPRRMMFGEISSDASEEKQLFVQKRVGERWEDGLLWYYGLQGLGASERNEKEVGTGKEKKTRGCFAGIKMGIGMLGRRMGSWVRQARCARLVGFGGFRALDG